jgi:hypothetical protein
LVKQNLMNLETPKNRLISTYLDSAKFLSDEEISIKKKNIPILEE